ncbi:uncharacterized protein METZ01_LOCUS257702, partial [marine metagenome]
MFNQNYKMFLTTLISILFFSNTIFGSAHISVCGVTDDGLNATFDICMISDEEIGGIQFTFDGDESGFEVSGAAGGSAADAGFTLSTSSSGTVLGFSFTGASIPAD